MTRATTKTFRVGYYLEQGFAINVQARSVRDAERIIRKRLDDECGELEGSERVHYDDGIASTAQHNPTAPTPTRRTKP